MNFLIWWVENCMSKYLCVVIRAKEALRGQPAGSVFNEIYATQLSAKLYASTLALTTA